MDVSNPLDQFIGHDTIMSATVRQKRRTLPYLIAFKFGSFAFRQRLIVSLLPDLLAAIAQREGTAAQRELELVRSVKVADELAIVI